MSNHPNMDREYNDDVAVYGKEAAIEKLYLETGLREEGCLTKERCAAVSNVWFAVVFLRCDYPDDVLESTARDLLRVPERDFRFSVCRRFVDALCERDVTTRIREMLP